VIALLLLGAWPKPTHAVSCTITQITSSGNFSGVASISANGARIAFTSRANLTGGNADGSNEIFLYDAATAAFTQVTNSDAGLTEGSSISADGTRIGFNSNVNLTGGNADHGNEVFLYDAVTSNLTQVTNGPSVFAESLSPSIRADGTRVAFNSSSDLTGSNADGNVEIFLYDTAIAAFTQITNSTAGQSRRAAISADGARVAFSSTVNLTGGNVDGNSEIFLYDTATANFTQITSSTSGQSEHPSISADGGRVAFNSTADLTGSNADGSTEIFLFDAATANLTQVTNSTAGQSRNAAINGDGTRIAFDSDADLTGGNAEGNREIFVFDTATSDLTQITNSAAGSSESASITSDGTRIAFSSSANLTGGNADRSSEVFLATCSLPSSERPADLMVSKSATPDPVKTGENLTYTIRVKNLGPGPAINLVMNDPLPADTTFVSAGSSHGSMTTPPAGSVGTVTCDAARLANGDTLTVTLVVNVTARGKTTITNEASAGTDCPDPNSSNDRAAVQTRIFGSRR
jgi:uncharacterized repeat protein (TIGR01451 family)